MKTMYVGMLASILMLYTLAGTVTALQDPYSIYGHVYGKDGYPAAGATVTITNQRTGDSIVTTTDSNGYYQENLLNMDSAYQDGDVIIVSANRATETGSASGVVDTDKPGTIIDVNMQTKGQPPQGKVYVLTIKVVDEDKNPIENASVSVDSSSEILTDENGLVSFSVASGTHTVKVSKDGYKSVTVSVDVTESKTVTITLEKEEAAIAAPSICMDTNLIIAAGVILLVLALIWIIRR